MPTLPPEYLDAVVALGMPNAKGEFLPIATGFFLGKRIRPDKNENEPEYKGYLVTNRHVLENKEFIAMRLNTLKHEKLKHYIVTRFDKNKIEKWHFHPDPNVDIAIIDIGSPQFVTDEIKFQFFQDDLTNLARSDFIGLGISEGDFLYTLGFPIGFSRRR